MNIKVGLFGLLLGLLAACQSALSEPTPPSPAIASPPAPSITYTLEWTSSPTLQPFTATPTVTITPTLTPQSTSTFTPAPTRVYQKLRGEVIVEQAVCHYGPGAPYLYKYGVYQGSNLEVLRRVEGSNYVEIRAIGGTNACWVKVDYLKIQGNWLDLEPVSADQVVLPRSPYYNPPTGVTAQRSGSVVTVSWYGIDLRPGDDSEQTPYIVEAWVCQQGKILFLPVGTYRTAVEITDEPGCAQPSRARLTAAEKHGYTAFVDIPWPPASQTTPDQ
uniref:SH3 domain-containing protein n=1 Tax=Anaerolinea thermolimosa TaxID=229919 RepID=A0A7C4PM39_9CHLR